MAIDSTKASLKQAQDSLTRQQQLCKGGPDAERDARATPRTRCEMRQADLNSQERQIETQRLRMTQEQASVENAKLNLSKVRIESPIDGIVTRRNIEEGETVVIGTMNNAGTVLLTIADMSVIEAEVEVDETDIPNVQLGQKAKVTIDAMPGKTFTGKVTEIGNSPIQAAGPTLGVAGDELQGQGHARRRDPRRAARASPAPPRSRPRRAQQVVAVPIQAMTVREMIVDKEGNIVRDEPKPAAASGARATGRRPPS